MKSVTIKDLALIFTVPLLPIIALPFDPHQKISVVQFIFFAPLNLGYFAAPLLVWFIILKSIKASRSTIYGGLIGANILLLSLWLFFLSHPGDGDSMGFIIYHPIAIVALLIGGLIGRLFSRHVQEGPNKPPAPPPPRRATPPACPGNPARPCSERGQSGASFGR